VEEARARSLARDAAASGGEAGSGGVGRRAKRRPALGHAALAAVGLLIFGAVALLHEVTAVVERGKDLLPYPADVVKVRVTDAVTLYVDVQPQPPADILNGMLLSAAATASLMTMLFLVRLGEQRRELLSFWALAAAALAYLALDELAAVHETLGHNMRFLADLPGVESPDVVVLAAYGIPAAVFVLRFWGVLVEIVRVRRLLALTASVWLVAEVADVASLPGEEALELTATIVGLLGLAYMIDGHLRRRIAPAASHGTRVETA